MLSFFEGIAYPFLEMKLGKIANITTEYPAVDYPISI
jgi:hypothetical protein